MPVALAALRSLGQRREEAVRDELDLDDAEASRRVLANDPIAPLSKRRTAAVLSATSTVGGEARTSRVDAAPTTDRLAHELPREVVEVGRLLDDLAAALVRAAPPRRPGRRVEPAGDDELRRRRTAEPARTSAMMSSARRW